MESQRIRERGESPPGKLHRCGVLRFSDFVNGIDLCSEFWDLWETELHRRVHVQIGSYSVRSDGCVEHDARRMDREVHGEHTRPDVVPVDTKQAGVWIHRIPLVAIPCDGIYLQIDPFKETPTRFAAWLNRLSPKTWPVVCITLKDEASHPYHVHPPNRNVLGHYGIYI